MKCFTGVDKEHMRECKYSIYLHITHLKKNVLYLRNRCV